MSPKPDSVVPDLPAPIPPPLDPEVVAAFNEWMRQYTEDPDGFRHSWQSVTEYLRETADGEEPSYGQNCAAYLASLISGLS